LLNREKEYITAKEGIKNTPSGFYEENQRGIFYRLVSAVMLR
jgi:hypothetical protein